MTPPDWLIRRGGDLAAGPSPRTLYVCLNGEPLWRLDALPARGRFTCAITQTNNGKRLDAGKDYPSLEAALTNGLEELRERLGW